MIRHQGPRVDRQLTTTDARCEPRDKRFPIFVVHKNVATSHPASHHVVESARKIEAGLSRHHVRMQAT